MKLQRYVTLHLIIMQPAITKKILHENCHSKKMPVIKK